MVGLFVGDFEQLRGGRPRLVGVGEKAGGGGLDGGEWGLELVGHAVDQRGTELLGLAGGFHLVGEVLGMGAFKADGDEVGDALQDGIGHRRALNGQRGHRLGARGGRR